MVSDMGSLQGIRALPGGVAIGGKIRVWTGSGSPVGTQTARNVGDLYVDYSTPGLWQAKATGTAGWEPIYSNGGFGAAANVSDGGTITHGYASAPTAVLITGSVAGQIVTVSSIGATTFTVAIKTNLGAAGTAQTIYWMAMP